METMDNESFVIKNFKSIPHGKIAYFGNFFHCFRIERLIKSFLFAKSWIDSSSKDSLPPDFHNEKHKIMMDVMRIDDCVNEKNGKKIANAFQRENTYMRKLMRKDYKNKYNASLYFVPNTFNNEDFNFIGYSKNFERVLINHSNKVDSYRSNYPKCKTCVLFVCDESNNYVQVIDKEDLNRKEPLGKYYPHNCFIDSKFLSIIKNVKAEYVVWMGRWKSLTVNGRRIKMPQAAIYDIKSLKEKGFEYNHDMMLKVLEETKIQK